MIWSKTSMYPWTSGRKGPKEWIPITISVIHVYTTASLTSMLFRVALEYGQT